MSSELLGTLVSLEVWGFAVGLTGLVVYQLLTGRMNMTGLLRDKLDLSRGASGGALSPTRVQLLMLTMAGAFGYLALLPGAPPGSLPNVPQELLLLVGGSSSIYLGGKSTRLVRAALGLSSSNRSNDPEVDR